MAGALAGGALLGCAPEQEDRASLITGPLVVAVRSSPAEAAAKEVVTLDALYVDPSGERPGSALDWAFCNDRKPLTDLGTISPTCLVPAGDALAPLGSGAAVSGSVPEDTCREFGPDRPEPKPGESAGRPADPDPSGGYHQPVRIRVTGDGVDRYAVGTTRIACGIGGATPEQAAEYGRRYRRNANPEISSLTLSRGDGSALEVAPASGDDPPGATIAAGETVTLDVALPDCAATGCGDGVCTIDEDKLSCAADCEAPIGCGGAERYLWFDSEARAIGERREALRVSWFVTAGELEVDRTGRTELELDASSRNRWTAPTAPSDVWLWVVVRDDRGGAGWRSWRLAVE